MFLHITNSIGTVSTIARSVRMFTDDTVRTVEFLMMETVVLLKRVRVHLQQNKVSID